MDPSLDQAEALLRRQGFACEREPSWVLKGKKPDFFCQGRASIWVEVKTLSATTSAQRQRYFSREFQQRSRAVTFPGDALAEISEKATAKDIKVVMKLTQLLLTECERLGQPWHRAFAVIPQEPVYDRIARFTVEEEEGPVPIICCESRSGRYEFPEGLEPRSYEEPVVLMIAGKWMEPNPLEDLLGSGHPLISLELVPGSDRFRVIVDLVDEDPWLRNNERLRACIKESDTQLRNGQKYQDVPSITLIYQDDVLVPADDIILAALYGDLTYTFPQGKPEKGKLQYGLNGSFGPSKNRSVSALAMIRNSAHPFLVHNYWAHLPLPRGLLGGREATRRDDGRFEFSVFPG
jgi:hypothetical protein